MFIHTRKNNSKSFEHNIVSAQSTNQSNDENQNMNDVNQEIEPSFQFITNDAIFLKTVIEKIENFVGEINKRKHKSTNKKTKEKLERFNLPRQDTFPQDYHNDICFTFSTYSNNELLCDDSYYYNSNHYYTDSEKWVSDDDCDDEFCDYQNESSMIDVDVLLNDVKDVHQMLCNKKYYKFDAQKIKECIDNIKNIMDENECKQMFSFMALQRFLNDLYESIDLSEF